MVIKRVFCLFISLVMFLSLAACGTENETPSASHTNNTEDASESVTDFFPDVQKQNYQGETFRILGWTKSSYWYYSESLVDEENNQSVLGNTVYEMNTLVEDYLGITLEYVGSDESAIFSTVQSSAMAGDDLYQLCAMHPYYGYNSFITQNYALDFYELPDFDITQPYWNRNVIEALSLNDHAYIGLGDMCEYDVYMLYCNKDMLGDANLEVPYEKVRNGEWTLDEFFGMTANLYVDDGDGKRNNKDTYGFAALWDANGTAFVQGCDIYVATRNEDGALALSLYSDRLVDMYEKLYSWSKDESTYIWGFGDRLNENVTINFAEGQVYFTHATLGTHFLSVEFALGILPMPKFDNNQESYAHVNWGNNLIVPSSIHLDPNITMTCFNSAFPKHRMTVTWSN